MAAGIATTPSCVHTPSILRSTPVSRFVALIFIPPSPTIIKIEESAGNVVFFRSAKRATVYTALINSFFSIEIFIQFLLGVLSMWIGQKMHIVIVYFYPYKSYNMLISIGKHSYK